MRLMCGHHLFLLPPNKGTPTIAACCVVIIILYVTFPVRVSHNVCSFLWQADGRKHSILLCWEAEQLGSGLPTRGRTAAYHSPQDACQAVTGATCLFPPPMMTTGNGYVIFRLVVV